VVLEPVRLISGEAGIGKPHLMHAALEVAEAEECVVLGGRPTTTTLG
jgi:chromosomal replication initiation ATPase DnaA